MKKIRVLLGVTAVLLFCSLFSGVMASSHEMPVYRLYSPVTGEHLYTMDGNERGYLSSIGWHDEGVAFWAFPQLDDSDIFPVYRLNNDSIRLHLYTSDQGEIASLQQQGWTVDGNGIGCFYCSQNFQVPVYRLYNPNDGQHLLTADENEYNALPALGWIQEGAKFNCFSKD